MLNQLLRAQIGELLKAISKFQDKYLSFELNGTKYTFVFAINEKDNSIKKAFDTHEASKTSFKRGQEQALATDSLLIGDVS